MWFLHLSWKTADQVDNDHTLTPIHVDSGSPLPQPANHSDNSTTEGPEVFTAPRPTQSCHLLLHSIPNDHRERNVPHSSTLLYSDTVHGNMVSAIMGHTT